MESIANWRLKIKNLALDAVGEWGLVAIVLLVGLGSFALGRLSALEEVRPPVAIKEAVALAGPQGIAPGGAFVASRTGTVYYYPWCSGASKIAAQNQVWFSSEQVARAAGYAPAKGCKGLTQQ